MSGIAVGLSPKSPKSVFPPKKARGNPLLGRQEGFKEKLEKIEQATNRGKSNDVLKGAKVITQRDYPALAAMKVAGRALEKIAETFGVHEANVRPHVMRALAKLREGEVDVNQDQVRDEMRKVADDKNEEFTDKLSAAYEGTSAMIEAFEGTSNPVSASVSSGAAPVVTPPIPAQIAIVA